MWELWKSKNELFQKVLLNFEITFVELLVIVLFVISINDGFTDKLFDGLEDEWEPQWGLVLIGFKVVIILVELIIGLFVGLIDVINGVVLMLVVGVLEVGVVDGINVVDISGNFVFITDALLRILNSRLKFKI